MHACIRKDTICSCANNVQAMVEVRCVLPASGSSGIQPLVVCYLKLAQDQQQGAGRNGSREPKGPYMYKETLYKETLTNSCSMSHE